jgi:hypothetical protein
MNWIYRIALLSFTFHFYLIDIHCQEIISNQKLQALRISERITIDGQLNEDVWKSAEFASKFTELEPKPGRPERFLTRVSVLYDDFSIYIGATLYDPSPDSILKELSLRDQIGNTDWFLIQIDPYKTGQLAFEFLLTASGVQVERKIQAPNRKDASWDAVWMSQSSIHENGWTVEIEIPYSALRFPTMDQQEWNINFARYIRRFREEYWWNPINPNISNRLHQSGRLTGILNIKAPPRIIVTPFVSSYFNHRTDRQDRPWRNRSTGGMDTKIGLSDAFTLDATLIPDFGQVRFDDIVFNLSPFEIQLQENRPFFTEGTELFNRGGIFYSRRIGDLPFYLRQNEWRLQPGLQNRGLPQASPLINATKISGRTNSGLGIGVFNALENRLFVSLDSTDNGEDARFLLNPLTNYNLSVIDQILPNNSFISFTNASVWREGAAYDANVSVVEYALRNKANAWMLNGKGALSAKMLDANNSYGHHYLIGIEKTKGTWQSRLAYEELSNTYDPNDLGFLPRNNERILSHTVSYNIFSPIGFLNFGNASLTTEYRRMYRPNEFSRFTTSLNSFFMTRDFFAFSVYSVLQPVTSRDYFDTRTRDFSVYYALPKNYLIGGFISTDYRKPFAYDLNGNFQWFDERGRQSWFLRFSPRVRLNDHLFFIYSAEARQLFGDVGFASRNSRSIGFETLSPKDVLYSKRDQLIVTNSFTGRYNFNPLNSLLLTLRHYWTGVDFNSFYTINSKGQLNKSSYTGKTLDGDELHSLNFTLFNIDLVYTMRFAPGSDLFIVWKNAISAFNPGYENNYFRSTSTLFNLPQENSLSIRVIFYLDYALLKRNLSS